MNSNKTVFIQLNNTKPISCDTQYINYSLCIERIGISWKNTYSFVRISNIKLKIVALQLFDCNKL